MLTHLAKIPRRKNTVGFLERNNLRRIFQDYFSMLLRFVSLTFNNILLFVTFFSEVLCCNFTTSVDIIIIP
jgi:hypothetical protein